MKNQDVLYQVKVTQDIPYWSGDEEFSFCESSGVTEEYVAGSFQSEEFARIFAEALKGKIAAGCDYAIMDATSFNVTSARMPITLAPLF